MDETARAKKESVLIFERIEQIIYEGRLFRCIRRAKDVAIHDLHGSGKIHTTVYKHNCPFCEMWWGNSCQECLWPTYFEGHEEVRCEDPRSPYNPIAFNYGECLEIADIRRVIELLKSL